METVLFHDDNFAFFDFYSLRQYAYRIVRQSPLIRSAASGDFEAAVALKSGFWPFVREFELAIDQQSLPRHQLTEKFGERGVRRVFTGIARAVREMKQEEGSHAAHWIKDARCLGIDALGDGPGIRGVRALVARSYTRDLPEFFATLAGTEFIAEELSRYLVGSPRFTALFDRRRWMWGEVHLAPHEDGPSHLEIDMDLARAYAPDDDAERIGRLVRDTVTLFARAADDVEDALLPQLLRA